MTRNSAYTFLLTIAGLSVAGVASAHEAYVLPRDYFWSSLHTPLNFGAFAALKNAVDLHVFLVISLAVAGLLLANFLFRLSPPGRWLHRFLEKGAFLGPHLVRFSVSAALFFSALSNSFLGPELPLSSMPHGGLIRLGLYAASAMIAAGFFVKVAALICLAAFIDGFVAFGPYLLTYFNYLGEFIVLVLFGMRVFSLDRLIFGPLQRFRFFERYETAIVRIFYGIALSYAAVTVKLLHPALTEHVVVVWHLTKFRWLFPSDPLLVTLGGGLAELAIGLFIMFGFEVRLTVLISLFYITLSLLYFRELVWPHLLLYGISLNLLVQPEVFTLDHLLFKKDRRTQNWWTRPFSPHNAHGKSSR